MNIIEVTWRLEARMGGKSSAPVEENGIKEE